MRADQTSRAETVPRQERVPDVHDRHGKAERPGHLRDGSSVLSGTEDHELGRGKRDFEEELGAANRLGTGRGPRFAQLVPGARDGFLLDDGVG